MREIPVEYLKRLIITWANTAILAGAKSVILGGDLNATWLATEAEGQCVLESWATEHCICNGPRLLAEHRGDTHITHPGSKDGKRASSWIDHLLHIGDYVHIDPLASFSSTGAEGAEVSDHRLLWTVYRTGGPITPVPTRPRNSKPHIELDLADKRVVEDYTKATRKYIARRPPDLSSSESAAQSLLALQNISPVVTAQINTRYGKDKKRLVYRFSADGNVACVST